MPSDFIAIPWDGSPASARVAQPLPRGLAVRGVGIFVAFYDGPDDAARALDEVVSALHEVSAASGARSSAAVVLGPERVGEADLGAVREALAAPTGTAPAETARPPRTAASPTGVVVDLARHRVTVDGRPVSLSFREHALLAFLVEHQGELHDRQRLLGALLGETDGEPISARTIDVYLQRLRRRIDPYGDVVRTVRGRGYRLDPHPDVTVVRG